MNDGDGSKPPQRPKITAESVRLNELSDPAVLPDEASTSNHSNLDGNPAACVPVTPLSPLEFTLGLQNHMLDAGRSDSFLLCELTDELVDPF